MLLLNAASAAKLSVDPYDGVRVLAGQRFDLRIEAEEFKGLNAAKVTLDGKAVYGLVLPAIAGGK